MRVRVVSLRKIPLSSYRDTALRLSVVSRQDPSFGDQATNIPALVPSHRPSTTTKTDIVDRFSLISFFWHNTRYLSHLASLSLGRFSSFYPKFLDPRICLNLQVYIEPPL
jgi:hypothetical protein